MLRVRRHHVFWIAGGCSALLAPATYGAEQEVIRLEYRAAEGCPNAEAFVVNVLRRTQKARFASGGEVLRTFSVVIERSAKGFDGSLSVQGESGPTVARKVEGARCDEVAEVLALSTALAIDPSVSPAPAVEPRGGEASGRHATSGATTSGTPGEAPRSRPDSETPRSKPDKRRLPAETRDEGDEPGEPDESDERSWAPETGSSGRSSLLGGAALRTGFAPDPAIGGTLLFASSPSEGTALATSLGAEFGYFAAPDSRVGGATASFQLLTARPRFCGPFARPSRTFGFAPCASAEIGVLLASGSNIPFPEKERRFWAAGVLSFVSQTLLSERWLVELEIGANLPLTRDRFVFVEPESSIHEVSGLGFAGGLKIGSRL